MEKKKILAMLCAVSVFAGTIGDLTAMAAGASATKVKAKTAVFAAQKKICLRVGKSKKIQLKKARGVKIKRKLRLLRKKAGKLRRRGPGQR